MRKRRLGTQGLEISEIGLGCMGMSEFYGPGNDEQSIATIHRAIDLGMTLFDTADMYGPFTNEQLLGRAIRGRRDQVVVATKFGNERRPDGSWVGINGRPEYVRAACDGSLKRLGIDTIDLYYQHRVDPNDADRRHGRRDGRSRPRRQGALPRSLRGRAEDDPPRSAVHPISALQTEYSLWSRDPEDEILPTVRELGIGFVAYSPIGRGFLSGRIKTIDDLDPNDFRRNNPRFKDANFQKNIDLVHRIEEIAKQKGVTPAQLAIAWVLSRGGDIVPIPGSRTVAHLQENVAATDIEITTDEKARIDAAAPVGAAAGDRYPDMSRVNL